MISERDARFRTRTLGWSCLGGVLASALIYGATAAFYAALLIPWIAALVYRQGHGAIHLIVGKGDPRPNLSHVYGFSIVMPGIWVLNEMSFLRWDLLVAFALTIGFLLALAAVPNPRLNRGELALLLLVNLLYGIGVAASLDQDLDSGAPEIRRAQILEKRITKSRRHVHYTLRLRSWSFPTGTWNLDVGEQDYGRVSVGQAACIDVHPGALGIPWFRTNPYRRSVGSLVC